MVKEKNVEVVLNEDDLLNGMEVFMITEALKLFNAKHKEDVADLESRGKNPFIGKSYFETVINHGLLWKLRKYSNKEANSNSEELKNGKL